MIGLGYGFGKGKERGERTDEVIRSCLAISYEACTRLTYAYAWAAEILAQPLVVFEEAAELKLRHGLFWA